MHHTQSSRKYTRITPKAFRTAVKGSGGLCGEIARRLGCSYSAIQNIVHGRTGRGKYWDKARKAFQDEIEEVGDLAETAIQDAMRQRGDIATAARTGLNYAKLRLRHRGFVSSQTTVLEGGVNPLTINTGILPLEKLDLPLNVRKIVLAAMEKYEDQQKGAKERSSDDEEEEYDEDE